MNYYKISKDLQNDLSKVMKLLNKRIKISHLTSTPQTTKDLQNNLSQDQTSKTFKTLTGPGTSHQTSNSKNLKNDLSQDL